MGTLTRIAVVGPQDSIDDLLRLAPLFPGIYLQPWPYTDERQTAATVQHLLATPPRPDVLLFTGPVPYYHARETVTPTVSMLYVPFTGAALYRALFLAKGTYPLDGVSVDTVPEPDVRDTLEELGLSPDRVRLFTLQYDTAIDRTEFVEFHRAHHDAGHTTLALTCLRSAHEALRSLALPCLRIVPPRSVLVATLEKAALLGDVEQVRDRQVVVGYVEARPPGAGAGNRTALPPEAADGNRQPISLDTAVRRLVGDVDGICVRTGPARWKFVTTRAFFGAALEAPDRLPLDRLRLPGWHVALGVGLGITAHQADVHAALALQHARRVPRDGPVAYLVLENKQVVGPLGRGGHTVTFSARAVDPGILALAARTGLGATLLNRVAGAVEQLRQSSFSADELAPLLSVSPRTARRVLRRLSDAGAAEVVGLDQAHRRGKPRRVFRLRWPAAPEVAPAANPDSGRE